VITSENSRISFFLWAIILVLPEIACAAQDQQSPNEMAAVLLSEATTPKLFAVCKKLFDEKVDVAAAEDLELAYRQFRDRQQTYFEEANKTIHALSGEEQMKVGFNIGYYSQQYSNALNRLAPEGQEAFCRKFVELLKLRQFDSGTFPSGDLLKLLGKN
jgi:hypothetical protein